MSNAPAVSLGEAITLLTADGAAFATRETVIRGIAQKAYVEAPSTLRDILLTAADRGDRPYIRFHDECLTYRQVYADACALAAAMSERYGIRKGDRVAICMRNYPEWAVAYWAVMALGGIVVPVNAWGTGAEMAYVVEHSAAALAIVDQERLERLRGHWGDCSVLPFIVARSQGDPGAASYTALVLDHSGAPLPPDPNLGPDDDATIFYTSGTTGRPKGAVGTHRNAVSCIVSGAFNVALSAVRRNGTVPSDPGDRQPPPYLYGGPLFHVGGCNSGLAATMAAGACIVLMSRWDAGQALALIEEFQIAGFGAVPTMIWQLLEHPDFARYRTSSLASVAIGGAAAGPELFARLSRRLPQVVAATGYGATETSGGCTFNGGLDYAAFPASVGVPAPIVEVKVVDQDGVELPQGNPGELCLRGACVVRGYWNDPEATAAAFCDGWFRSGDIATIDASGRITILDRAKDMIIRGGENVYSIEVEDALLAHEAVVAAAVFGVPDQIFGEKVAAVVQLRAPNALDQEELTRFLVDRIARFKIPEFVRFTIDDLPKNETGKIMKRLLRKSYFR